jgi:hypothetical protein
MLRPMAFESIPLTRRAFVKNSTLAAGACLLASARLRPAQKGPVSSLSVADLPRGGSPRPVASPHFPDRLHAFVWRNWTLVPAEKMAAVIGATKADVLRLGHSMGLPNPPRITADQRRRSYITVLKRNWHLLPYEQLLALLDWTPEQMAYTLREDDFLFIKLGSLKPQCDPLKFEPPTDDAMEKAAGLAQVLGQEFPAGIDPAGESLFAFVQDLSTPPSPMRARPRDSRLSPRFCYSYFALYGDPLLETEADPYPDGYLARLAQTGVDGVWLQGVLYKLAPFPWQPESSVLHQERLAGLRKLVARARRHGIRLYLYLNEPRAMPLAFFATRPGLKGVVEGDHAALCTSHPEVQRYLTESIAFICRSVPGLGGFFTITGSENLTNCWSHGGGKNCPRCGRRPPADVIAEVNRLIVEGIQTAAPQAEAERREAKKVAASETKDTSAPELIVWDWGWQEAWTGEIIRQLPPEVSLMSVSEWSLPLERGGVKSEVGEYSISAVGPGPRALRHWKLARERGLKTIAKIQAGNTWELSAVPYIPALANVARHAANLREAHLDGLMLGWTLGGYPSPNLEVAIELAGAPPGKDLSPEEAMTRVAERRFGKVLAPIVVTAWRQFSVAFSEFPFNAGLVYSAPLQVGPANPLWAEPTGYHDSMVGFPYDDLDGWRAVYPPEVFIGQFDKVASGFRSAIDRLEASITNLKLQRREEVALRRERNVAAAAAIHFKSVANQARFILARRPLAAANRAEEARPHLAILEEVLRSELDLARRLFRIQTRDSRIGFEASNQYYYVPLDLVEKVVNCRDLLDHWLPKQRSRWAGGRNL